jgi:hypothetical protein
LNNLLVPDYIPTKPAPTDSNDWLSGLPEGSEFLCKVAPITQQAQSMPNYILHMGTVIKHVGAARYIDINGDQKHVDPKVFCTAFSLFEIVADLPVE